MIAERRISHLTLQTRTAQVLYEGQTEDSSRCKLFTQPCMLHLIIRHRQKHFFFNRRAVKKGYKGITRNTPAVPDWRTKNMINEGQN